MSRRTSQPLIVTDDWPYLQMWLTIASILATFTLSKAKDKDGNEIEIKGDFYDSGIITSVLY